MPKHTIDGWQQGCGDRCVLCHVPRAPSGIAVAISRAVANPKNAPLHQDEQNVESACSKRAGEISGLGLVTSGMVFLCLLADMFLLPPLLLLADRKAR